jgi:uncharacterized membrane protein
MARNGDDMDQASDPRALMAAFAIAFVAFLALDLPWLTLVSADLFRARLGATLRPEPLLLPAAAFYVVYAAGLVHLAVRPALFARSGVAAAVSGAVLGLVAYATFDLTNLAVIRGWTWDLALFDMAWGAFASCLTAFVAFLVASRVHRAGAGA